MALGRTSARYGERVPTPHYGQPRYRAIADQLRKRIESGTIPPGALLPAESSLTTDFRASRGTIRQAIAVLREQGFVATEHGRGTYAVVQVDETEVVQREVNADNRLAALFVVEVGTPLSEREAVTRRDGQVEEVIRTYRRRPTDV